MKTGLLRIAQPEVEPVTLDDVKTYTRVGDDDSEDVFINTWIKAGRIKAENYQRRSFITQDWRLALDAFPAASEVIYLPRGPLQSLQSVTYRDRAGVEEDYDITKFIVDTDTCTIRLKTGEQYPTPSEGLDCVKINYRTGYGDAPEDLPEYIADVIYIYCAYRYENRLGETDMIPRVFYTILDEERRFNGLQE